jgi:uncharacterized protein (DUF1778 family)
MLEIKNETIGLRVTKSQKSQLLNRAEQAGMSLSDFLLTVVDGYDELAGEVESLRAELDAEQQEHARRRTALDRASELAEKVTAEKVEDARRQAVAEYRAQLMEGAAADESESVAALRQRLAAYENPSLAQLFEQVKGNETDIVENGEVVTVVMEDLPDLVRVLAASFSIAQPQTSPADVED